MMEPYVIFGFSHFLGDIIDCIESSGDFLKTIVLNVPETPVVGRLSLSERLARLERKVEVVQLDQWRPEGIEQYVVGFSGSQMKLLLDRLKFMFGPLNFEPLLHRTAILQKGCSFGAGAVVNAGSIIGPWAQIGNHTIVNRGVTIGHDFQIGRYGFLSPSAALCSHVTLGENVKVGANATILPDVQVGDNVTIGAGAVVLEDVPEGATVVGVPAKEVHRP